jgi:serine protease Do
MRIFILSTCLLSLSCASIGHASFFGDAIKDLKGKFFSKEKKEDEKNIDEQIDKEDQEINNEEEQASHNDKSVVPPDVTSAPDIKASEQSPSNIASTETAAVKPELTAELKPVTKTAEPLFEKKAPEYEKVIMVEKKSSSSIKNNFNVSQGFADIVEKALPAVVNVATTQVVGEKEEQADMPPIPGFAGSPFEDLFKKFMEQQQSKPRKIHAVGSGFIIHADDKNFYVVTNYHVVQDTKKIKLFMNDKTEVDGIFHSGDERTDIAIIKVAKESLPENKRDVSVLEWGIEDDSRVGDWVIAIGNSFGFGSSVTVGILSHKGRDMISRVASGRLSDYIDDYIQHSAQINFGNSGGCLLNNQGKVIGINTAIISPSGGNVGVGFAIPARVAMKTVKQLLENGRTKRGWLGVKIQAFTEEMAESIGQKNLANKPVVVSVTPEGPAEKAGIEEKDIIIAFNGKALSEQVRLSRLVGETEVGTTVPITVWRKNREVILNVHLGEYEDAEQKGQLDDNNNDKKADKKEKDKVLEILGITFSPLTNQLKERLRIQDKNLKGGVVVLKVDPSRMMDIPLMRGDVIIEVNQVPIETPQTFVDIVEEAKKSNHRNLLLLITRNESEPHYLTIRISDEDNEEMDKSDVVPPKQSKVITEHPGNRPKSVM